MQQSALNAKVLNMACEMIIAQEEILRLCLNVLSDELKKQNCSLKICQDSEMAEHYVICQPQEKPCFSVVMGYFAGGFCLDSKFSHHDSKKWREDKQCKH